MRQQTDLTRPALAGTPDFGAQNAHGLGHE
jgi:hypothetical protein